MNAPTPPITQNANDAQLLAPETHPRAGVEVEFTAILQEALSRPGVVNEAYRAFHNYSLGNQILAAMQLAAKGLRLSPIASFNGWKEKGRFVQKAQKALSLFMPVSVKRRKVQGAAAGIVAGSGEDRGATFNVFVLRAHWFSLEQTEGAGFEPEMIVPTWDAATALPSGALVLALTWSSTTCRSPRRKSCGNADLPGASAQASGRATSDDTLSDKEVSGCRLPPARGCGGPCYFVVCAR